MFVPGNTFPFESLTGAAQGLLVQRSYDAAPAGKHMHALYSAKIDHAAYYFTLLFTGYCSVHYSKPELCEGASWSLIYA
jgi:hypothetical protein